MKSSSFILGSSKMPRSRSERACSLASLVPTLAGLQAAGLVDQGSPAGRSPRGARPGRRNDLVLQLGRRSALLVLGQVVEVVGDAPFDPLLAVSLGVGQDLLALSPSCVPAIAARRRCWRPCGAGASPCEADGPARRRVVGRCADRLVLDVAGQGVVEVELLAVQLERRRRDLALGEELLDLAGLGVGEGDQGLLGPPQVERGAACAAWPLPGS